MHEVAALVREPTGDDYTGARPSVPPPPIWQTMPPPGAE